MSRRDNDCHSNCEETGIVRFSPSLSLFCFLIKAELETAHRGSVAHFSERTEGKARKRVTWGLECETSWVSSHQPVFETKWIKLTWGHRLSIWVAAIRTNFTPSSLLEIEQAKLATWMEEYLSENYMGAKEKCPVVWPCTFSRERHIQEKSFTNNIKVSFNVESNTTSFNTKLGISSRIGC